MYFLTVKLRDLFIGVGKKCLYQSKIVVRLVATEIKRFECPTVSSAFPFVRWDSHSIPSLFLN